MRSCMAAACAGAWLLGGVLVQAGAAVSESLVIALAATPGVAEAARRSLMAEAGRIWAAEGLRLVWDTPQPKPLLPALAMPDRAALRVLLVTRATPGGTRSWAVGELLPLDGGNADGRGESLALISLTAAAHVLATARTSDEPEALAQHRLGLVLGRAVAHEIGHYLLGTRTHARGGLMRARIPADEFADLRDGGFALDRGARAWLRDSWHRRPGASGGAGAAFAYVAR